MKKKILFVSHALELGGAERSLIGLLDAIDPQYLSEREKGWLNAYHKEVFEKLSPYLTGDETEWLRKYTRAI